MLVKQTNLKGMGKLADWRWFVCIPVTFFVWMFLTKCSVIPPVLYHITLNTLRPRQNGRHFADDIFKSIFLNENVWIPITISLKFVPKGPINNIPALVQIMAWRRPGDKPLSDPMMINLTTHKCVTRPQWINMLSFTGGVGISVDGGVRKWKSTMCVSMIRAKL